MSASGAMELSGDILRDTFCLSLSGHRFQVMRSGETTYVLDEDGKQKKGFVRAAGPSSGSIWKNGDCIGEYYAQDLDYFVVPIHDGFRQPDRRVKIHPLAFLLQ